MATRKPIEVFCCYARHDRSLLQKLQKHLVPLQREGLLVVWADLEIEAGAEWEKEIHQHLDAAQIILLLISPDFMASDYCYSVEMQRAIERHARGEAHVIPIILRPVAWQKTSFGKFQALPANTNPVTSTKWHHQDNAFYEIVEGLRGVAEALRLAEERRRLAAEAEQRRISEEKQRRLAAEVERIRLLQEEQRRLSVEAEQRRLAAEAEQRRISEEKQRRLAAEVERIRLLQEEQRLLAAETEDRRRYDAAEQQRQSEEKQRRLAAEAAQARRAEEERIYNLERIAAYPTLAMPIPDRSQYRTPGSLLSAGGIQSQPPFYSTQQGAGLGMMPVQPRLARRLLAVIAKGASLLGILLGFLFVLLGLSAWFDNADFFTRFWLWDLFFFLGLMIFFLAIIGRRFLFIPRTGKTRARQGRLVGSSAIGVGVFLVVGGVILTVMNPSSEASEGPFIGIISIIAGLVIWRVTRLKNRSQMSQSNQPGVL